MTWPCSLPTTKFQTSVCWSIVTRRTVEWVMTPSLLRRPSAIIVEMGLARGVSGSECWSVKSLDMNDSIAPELISAFSFQASSVSVRDNSTLTCN